MDTTQDKSREIVSFNESIPELSDLLEFDGATLDEVVGGNARPPDDIECCVVYCSTFS